MPFTSDPRWKAFQRHLRDLSKTGGSAQEGVLRPIKKRVQAQVRSQLATGTGPDGTPQRKTKRGKPALLSRKIAGTVYVKTIPGGVQGTSEIEWLETHQKGHTFPARRSAGQILTFSRRGRLLSGRRQRRAKFVFDVAAREHTVGQRVLPPTPIYPERGTLTEPWKEAVVEGAIEGMRAFIDKATK